MITSTAYKQDEQIKARRTSSATVISQNPENESTLSQTLIHFPERPL